MEAKKEIQSSETPIGTVYLTGDSVQNGHVDLEKTVRYLNGLEKALKYHINRSDSNLANKKYSIEVQLRPGSLVTDILTIVGGTGVIGVAAVAVGSYAKTAAEQFAKNDVGDSTTKDAAKGAIKLMVSTMKIAKHRGSMMLGKSLKPEETKVIDADNIILINGKGEELKVTKKELDRYRDTPKNEFRDMMSLIDKNTNMYIDSKPIDGNSIPDSALSIGFDDKRVFDDRDDSIDNMLIFPELVQDDMVTLDGELTRGNGRSNTLGFSYSGRILKCIPYGSDSVKSMRDMLFGYVRIKARVDRRSTAKGSEAILKKPILRIMEIEKIEEEQDDQAAQTSLLPDSFELSS
jgi:hypothetical protein